MSTQWDVFDYERDMAVKLQKYLPDEAYKQLPWELQNAVIEGLVLHTRVLIELILEASSRLDDIKLSTLLPGFTSARIAQLDAVYGDNALGTPRWQFNKLLAHATIHRTTSHEYMPALRQVWAELARLLEEIEIARTR